jgi:hypothetical protein
MCSWDDDNKIELVGIDWIHLAQDRDKKHAVVHIVMNLQFPLKKNFLTS